MMRVAKYRGVQPSRYDLTVDQWENDGILRVGIYPTDRRDGYTQLGIVLDRRRATALRDRLTSILEATR